jgi:apolipoprotein N-acyltransferase
MRIALGCALAALTGVLATLSFAPYDAWWVVWFAFVPMIVAQYRVLPARWSSLGPAIGVGGFVFGYVGGAFPAHAAWYMRALPLVFFTVLFASVRGGRVRQDRVGYRWLPISAAISWVVVEFVRIPFIATWGYFGYALYRQSWLLQPVRAFGIFGLDLLIALVNYALALGMMAALDHRRRFEAPVRVESRQALAWCAVAFGATAVWTSASLMWPGGDGPTVRVAALQPGVRPFELGKTNEERDRHMLERLSAQTRIAAGRAAQVVVWPEAALSMDPALAHRAELGDLARETGAYLVVGYGIVEPAGRRNEAVTVTPSGEIVGRYGKNHPVSFLGGSSIWRGVYPTVDAPFGKMGSVICYDMDFTDTPRELALRGAKLVAVPSADWSAIASKHYTFAVFRALETGAAFAKSEYSRDSAIVDPYGRIVASVVTPNGSEDVLVGDVALRSGVPLAARWGDWVAWLCLLAVAVRAIRRVAPRIGRTMSRDLEASEPRSSSDRSAASGT